MSDAPQSTPPKKNYLWIYFFVFLVVASVSVTWLMIWFNLSIQLTPESLAAAKETWKAKGPKNYNMMYTKRLNDDAKTDSFVVEVRGGEVKSVRMNGKPLERGPDDEKDYDPRPFHSMDGLFRDLEGFLRIDQKPGAPKVFCTAVFDDQTGALRKYIRRVMGTTQRIEINVTLDAVAP